MNDLLRLTVAVSLLGAAIAQSPAIFPAEYSAVAEGPLDSPNLPLAYGTSRVQMVYERADLNIPNGRQIRRLGFRQDATFPNLEAGRSLQLEIRMGYSSLATTAVTGTFDTNYTNTPTTVFGPALLALPALRDPAAPLPNGQFWITLTTPFTYNPGSNNLVVEYRVYGTSGGGAPFAWRLDRADYYSPTALGPDGCAHSGGQIPRLTVDPVRTAGYYSSALTLGPAQSLAVLAMTTGAPLATPYSLQPFLPGIATACRGQISLTNPLALTAVTNSSGGVYYSFFVPNSPALYNDLYVSSQAVLLDFFAPGGAAVSNGAQVQIGIPPRCTTVYAGGPPSTLMSGAASANYCPVSFFDYQ